MQPDLRISVKDYRPPPSLRYGATSNKNLKVLLVRVPFGQRQFLVRMKGQPWPKDSRPVSLTRVLIPHTRDKAVVRSPGMPTLPL